MDRERVINDYAKGRYSHLECIPCGKRSLVGNMAQRIKEGWPHHCGKRMVPIQIGDKVERHADGSWSSVPEGGEHL